MSEVALRELALPEADGELLAALEYWRGLRGGRLAPPWPEFDLMRIPLRLLPTTAVIDVTPDGLIHRFYGSGFTRYHGVDLTGKSPLELPHKALGQQANAEYGRCIRSAAPTLAVYDYQSMAGFGKGQRVLRLPLSGDGVTIDHVVAVIRFTQNAADYREMTSAFANP